MVEVSTILAPLIFGLLLIMVLNRAIVFWQRERTERIFYSFLFFLTLCLLYLSLALAWPSLWREVVRVLLVWSLIWGNYHEWTDLVEFLRKKYNARQADVIEQPTTLEALGEAQRDATGEQAVALEATEKPNNAAKHL